MQRTLLSLNVVKCQVPEKSKTSEGKVINNFGIFKLEVLECFVTRADFKVFFLFFLGTSLRILLSQHGKLLLSFLR